MRTFKYYFLPWFVIFGVIGLYGLIKNWDVIEYKLILFLSFTVLCVPLIIGGLVYWAESKWTPQRRKKFYKREPFLTLEQNGFVNEGNMHFHGIIKKYHVFVNYDHTFDRSINFVFLYDPNSVDEQYLKRTIWKASKDKINPSVGLKGNLWLSMPLKLKMPDYERVEEYLNYGIAFLKEHGIQPITEKDLEKFHENFYHDIDP